MSEPRSNSKTSLPKQRVFEANFPMQNHVCDGQPYRLDHKEDTGRQRGGKNVVKYVFVLDERESPQVAPDEP